MVDRERFTLSEQGLQHRDLTEQRKRSRELAMLYDRACRNPDIWEFYEQAKEIQDEREEIYF